MALPCAMRTLLLSLAAVVVLGLHSAPAFLQSRGGGHGIHGGEDETGPYELERNWPQPFASQGYIWGSQGGVLADKPDRIFLLNRRSEEHTSELQSLRHL